MQITLREWNADIVFPEPVPHGQHNVRDDIGPSLFRVINPESDTRPNIYYMSLTAPLNWPVKAEIPTPIQLWKFVNPLVWGFVGLNALGVLAMLGKQLLVKDEPPVSVHEEKKEDAHE